MRATGLADVCPKPRGGLAGGMGGIGGGGVEGGVKGSKRALLKGWRVWAGFTLGSAGHE